MQCVSSDLVRTLGSVRYVQQSIAGDYTPLDAITPAEKHRVEREAMLTIRSTLEDTVAGQELLDLWEEYERQDTVDARFVKDLDRFEMIVTAYEYEQAQPVNLDSFWRCTQGVFKHPIIQDLDTELRARRTIIRPA